LTEPRRRRRVRKTRSHPSPGAAGDPQPEEEIATIEVPQTDDLVEPDNALPQIRLEDLSEGMQKACGRAEWKELMPVQARTIPYVLAHRDLMIQSRTGSGKTGAFLLPMLDRIDPELAQCQALILVPTRELAQQVYDHAEILVPDGIRTIAVYGGVGYGKQLEAFRAGAHLVAGTPGRVLDHLMQGNLDLQYLKMLVFDEADRMLSMGFYQDMKRVKRFLSGAPRNGYMFSATFPYHVMRLAGEFLEQPDMLSLSRDHIHVTDVDHVLYFVPDMKKDRTLARLIELENPTSAIIFCNTKVEVNYVSLILKRYGYDADGLSSELKQRDREKVLTRVRQGSLRFLVATDVAARGIDIQQLSHVFQYEVPEDPELYVHRAGRTGRAGAGGKAITLAFRTEKMRVDEIKNRYGIEFEELEPPQDEEVEKVVSERLIALLEARLRERRPIDRERMRRFLPLARELSDHEDEALLVAMLLNDTYQQSLHAPVVVEEPEEKAFEDKAAHGGSSRAESGQDGRRQQRSVGRERSGYGSRHGRGDHRGGGRRG